MFFCLFFLPRDMSRYSKNKPAEFASPHKCGSHSECISVKDIKMDINGTFQSPSRQCLVESVLLYAMLRRYAQQCGLWRLIYLLLFQCSLHLELDQSRITFIPQMDCTRVCWQPRGHMVEANCYAHTDPTELHLYPKFVLTDLSNARMKPPQLPLDLHTSGSCCVQATLESHINLHECGSSVGG